MKPKKDHLALLVSLLLLLIACNLFQTPQSSAIPPTEVSVPPTSIESPTPSRVESQPTPTVLAPPDPTTPALPTNPPDKDVQSDDIHTQGIDASIIITPEQAYDIFKEAYPNARVKQIELDRDNQSRYLYEVEGYEANLEYEIKIDVSSGRILKTEKDSHKGDGGEILKEDLAKIPDLVRQALQKAGAGFRVKEWKLEIEHNQVIFEIELLDQNNRKVEYKFPL